MRTVRRIGRWVRTAAAPALATATAASLLAGGMAPAVAAAAGPVAPRNAPAQVEGLTPYLPQVSCDPSVKPGTAALRTTLLAAYGGRDLGVTRGCEVGARSEHKEGRAWDWGLRATDPAENDIARRFLSWLLADGPGGGPAYNARRLGVMYVIWDGTIWSAYRASDGWRPYGGGEAHEDHIHISLAWNGAMKRTSWWTGRAAGVDYGPCPAIEGELAAPYGGPRATPCPAPVDVMTLTGRPVLHRESTGTYVSQLQRLLSVTPVSGYFGPVTDAALRAFQSSHELYVSGKTYGRTWDALRNQSAPVSNPSPSPAPDTAARAFPDLLQRMTYTVRRGDTLGGIARHWRSSVTAIKTVNRLRGDTIRPGQVLVLPVRSWLTKYTWTTIRKGNHNRAVRALQTALRMPVRYRTSVFGDITKGYVNRLKGRHGWAADGVAGPGVWRKLGA